MNYLHPSSEVMIPRRHDLVRVHLRCGVTRESWKQEIRVQFRDRAKLPFEFRGVVLGRLLNGRRRIDEQQKILVARRPLLQRGLEHTEEETSLFGGGLDGLRRHADLLNFLQFCTFLFERHRHARIDGGKKARRGLMYMFFDLRLLRRKSLGHGHFLHRLVCPFVARRRGVSHGTRRGNCLLGRFQTFRVLGLPGFVLTRVVDLASFRLRQLRRFFRRCVKQSKKADVSLKLSKRRSFLKGT